MVLPTIQPAWDIYAQQMLLLGYGTALWQPAPLDNYERVSIGDVGYIRRGRFHLLFSAVNPLGSRRLGEDVPYAFEPLSVGRIVRDQPRLPGVLCTSSGRINGADIAASVTAPGSIAPGARFSFELTDTQGAILVTKHSTYREDVEREGLFRNYIKRHYDSWVAFAREGGHGDDVQPILVTGTDMTLDFAMLAYSDNTRCIATEFKAEVPTIMSASASVWGAWYTDGLVHHNCGPQVCVPPSAPGLGNLQGSPNPEIHPNSYDQCIFLRYYMVRKRAGLFPKVIKAGAGPHTLDSNRGPGDCDFGIEIPNGDPMEENTVVQNTFLPIDPLDYVADHIFQNSNAEIALIHHNDILSVLRQYTGTTPPCGQANSIRTILSECPRILIDLDRTGYINAGPDPLSTTSITAEPIVHWTPSPFNAVATTQVKLTVFLDLICPWCYINQRSLFAAIEDITGTNPNISFEIKYHPFILVPNVKDDEPLDRLTWTINKFGEEKARALMERVAERAKEYNLEFKYNGKICSTLRAHRLLLKAWKLGGQNAQQNLLDGLFKAYFEEALDISNLDVLAVVAQEASIMNKPDTLKYLISDEELQEVDDMIEQARTGGVSGVPVTVIDNKWAISGAQDKEAYLQVFRKLAIRSDYNDAGGPDTVRICPTIFQHHGTATVI